MIHTAQHTLSPELFERAALLIKKGGVVAFPTETTYGLAVDPFSPAALSRLYRIKARSHNKALPVLVSNRKQLSLLVRSVPPQYSVLMKKYWPGPLTLIFDAKDEIPVELTGHSGSVAIRISSHPVAKQFVEAVGGPVTATSANISGQPAALTAAQLNDRLGDSIDLLLPFDYGVEGGCSTIVASSGESISLVRAGVLDFKDLLDLVIRRILPEHS